MEYENNYYDFAENDYWFLRRSVSNGIYGNAVCSIGHDICDRYLKSIMERYVDQSKLGNLAKQNYDYAMNHHSLRITVEYVLEHFEDFDFDMTDIMKLYDANKNFRYPGKDSHHATLDEVNGVWNAVQKCKAYVDQYGKLHDSYG